MRLKDRRGKTPENPEPRYGGDCMVVCNDWHSALVPMLIHAEKPTGPKPCSRQAAR